MIGALPCAALNIENHGLFRSRLISVPRRFRGTGIAGLCERDKRIRHAVRNGAALRRPRRQRPQFRIVENHRNVSTVNPSIPLAHKRRGPRQHVEVSRGAGDRRQATFPTAAAALRADGFAFRSDSDTGTFERNVSGCWNLASAVSDAPWNQITTSTGSSAPFRVLGIQTVGDAGVPFLYLYLQRVAHVVEFPA